MNTQCARKFAVRIVTGGVLFLFALALYGASERSSRLPVEQDWPDLMTELWQASASFGHRLPVLPPEARAYIEQLQQRDVSLSSPRIGIIEGAYSP